MKRFLKKHWLKAFAGLSINISAGFLALPFVGYSINFPHNLVEILTLMFDLFLAIMFLLASVWCEKRSEKRR